MAATFRLKTFGRFTLTGVSSDIRLPVPAGKAQALFVYLALTRQPASREWLADFLWPELTVEAGRFNLRHTLFNLRRVCGDDLFVSTRDQIGIVPGRVIVDAAVLQTLAESEWGSAQGIAIAAAEETAEACKEDFLSGFWLPGCDDFGEWLENTRQSLRRQLISLYETLAERRIDETRPDMGIHHARCLTELMPYDDGARRRLIRLLIESRRTGAALAEFEHFKTLLANDLGAQPAEETIKLAHAARSAPTTGESGVTETAITAGKKTQQEWRIAIALYCERATTDAGNHDVSAQEDRDASDTEDTRAECANIIFQTVVTAHGGICGVSPAGGLLAYFGHPIAYEGAPASAVEAGLALVSEFAKAKLVFRLGAHLALALCDGARPDITGDLTRVAQRISLVAEGGQFAVSGQLRAVVDRFRMVPMGERLFRGLAPRFRVFRVGSRTFMRRAAQLTGRDSEQAELLVALEQSRQDSHISIGLRGAPGMGKTALAESLMKQARRRGVFVIALRSLPDMRKMPFHPVQNWLHEYLPHHKSAPGLVELLVDDSGKVESTAVRQIFNLPARHCESDSWLPLSRESLITALLQLLDQIVSRSPVLIFADDLHWADTATLELLSRVAKSRTPRTLLLLATRESVEQSVLYDRTVQLRPLASDAAMELLRREASPGPDIRQTAQWVEQGKGSPLLLKALARNDALLSTDMHVAMQIALDALGPYKRVAQIAAVLGDRIETTPLAALCRQSSEECAVALQGLVEASVLMRTSEAEEAFSFCHAAIREAAYQALPAAERRQAHLDAALMLADSAKPHLAEQIAHHFQIARKWEAAARWWLTASGRCMRPGDPHKTLSFLEAGIDTARKMPDGAAHQELMTALQLAQIEPLAALYGPGSTPMQRTIGELSTRSLHGISVESRFTLSWSAWRCASSQQSYQAAISSAEELMQLARKSGDRIMLDYALYACGYIDFSRGRLMPAARHFARIGPPPSIEVQRAIPLVLKDNVWVNTQAFEGWIAWFQGRRKRAWSLVAQSRANAEAIGDAGPVAISLMFEVELARLSRDITIAERASRQLSEIALDQHCEWWSIAAAAYEGWVGAIRGDVERAEHSIISSAMIERTAPGRASLVYLIAAEAMLFCHRLDDASHQLAAARASMERREERHLMAECERLCGYVQWRKGNKAAAATHLDWALSLARKQGAPALAARAQRMLHLVSHGADVLDADGQTPESGTAPDKTRWDASRVGDMPHLLLCENIEADPGYNPWERKSEERRKRDAPLRRRPT